MIHKILEYFVHRFYLLFIYYDIYYFTPKKSIWILASFPDNEKSDYC